ncbi:hypothetical protein TrispH2_004626 [Trichoplax sp. H2]|nr:hypothetical protein TrispH2_004626 [Trichoplax sp. H2]|eukprot:RDD44203.1 hypothetical protein TrispH2_004626 [Trichoplax sp. H2]
MENGNSRNSTNNSTFFVHLLIAFRVSTIIISILIVAINLFFFLFIMFCKTLRTPSNVLILSINLSCIIAAFTFILPIAIVRGVNIPLVCIIFLPLGDSSALMVNIHACLICLEHYCINSDINNNVPDGLTHPFHYQRYISNKVVIGCCIILWILVLGLITALYVILDNLQCPDWTANLAQDRKRLIIYTVVASVMTGLPLITMLYTYLKLHYFILQHLIRIDSEISHFNRETIITRKHKVLRRMLFLLINFSVCWLPILITTLIIFRFGYKSQILIAIRNISFAVTYLYSLAGPLGYIFCCPDIAKKLRRWWVAIWSHRAWPSSAKVGNVAR